MIQHHLDLALLVHVVSIARRLQDPLVELVKIDPQHIGVGMYQHDISESKLKARLDSVLSECVSFVGVEINTATEHVLRYVGRLQCMRVCYNIL